MEIEGEIMKHKGIYGLLIAVILICSNIVYASKPFEIKNTKPQASFTVSPRKQVDLVLLTNYNGQKLANLQASVNELQADLTSLNYKVNVSYVTSTKQYGTVMDRQFNYFRNVYYDADWDGKSYFHLTSADTIIEPYHYRVSLPIENVSAYESQFDALPVRNPGTPSLTRGSVYYPSEGKYSYYTYNVDVTWSNDVETTKQFIVNYKTNDDTNGVGNEMYDFPPRNEKTTIDKSFVRGTLLAETPRNLNLLDVDQIKNIPLSSGSERYLFVVDDGIGKDFVQSWGTYFASIGMDASLRDYIKKNNFKVKAVTDTSNLDIYLDKSPIISLSTEGDVVTFVTSDGKALKMGSTYGTYNDYPMEFEYIPPAPATPSYPYKIPGVTIKKVLDYSTYYKYILGTDGNLYCYNISNNTYQISYTGIYDIASIKVSTTMYTAVIYSSDRTKITSITSSNYGSTFNYTAPYPIKELFTISDLGTGNFCYTDNGNIYQYAGGTITLEGVQSYYINAGAAFVNMNDGTSKVIYTNYVGYSYGHKSGYSAKYGVTSSTLLEQLNGIKKVVKYVVPDYIDNANYFRYGYTMYLILDNSNKLFYYKKQYRNASPVSRTEVVIGYVGAQYMDAVVSYTNASANYLPVTYLLTSDNKVLKLLYPDNPNWGTSQFTTNVVAMAGIEKVTDQGYGKVFLLLNDSTVRDETLANPIKQRATISITGKTYLSFREFLSAIPDYELYGVGAYQQAIDKIFIDAQKALGSSKNYMLINDILDYKTKYTDYESDPEYATRWLYFHDSTYFDNSNGAEINSGRYLSSPISPFTKVGKYTITMEKRDNPKNDDNFDAYRLWSVVTDKLIVYAHRKPIALQRLTIANNGNGTYTVKVYDAGSYDPDHVVSRADKGITAREWRWKELTSIAWTAGQMNKTDCSPDKSYITQLRVKDLEGVWSDYNTITIDKDNPPVALFSIDKKILSTTEYLKVKDLSFPQSFSPITKWHWIVKKLNKDGSVPSTNIQDDKFSDSNTGTGAMAGYDVNVKTHYADKGAGKYRIYLRVMNGNGMWYDGGTESSYNLNNFFYKDFEVQESFKISKFRVAKIRDLHLEPYYYYENGSDYGYKDKPFYVNDMAIDPSNFKVAGISLVPGFVSLTKGYRFEFEIDTTNFNEANDTIVITPSFFPYTRGVPGVRGQDPADLYWEDSDKKVYKAGEGAHKRWAVITLDSSNRTITGTNSATWRGEYFIPATSWLVPQDTSAANAKSKKINADIIVNFSIKGYKDGIMKYDYNLQQWSFERTIEKYPYKIGDVIRYDYTKSSLDDKKTIINRP